MILHTLLQPLYQLFPSQDGGNLSDTEKAVGPMDERHGTLDGSKFRRFIPPETRPGPLANTLAVAPPRNLPFASHTGRAPDEDISLENLMPDSQSSGVRLLPLLSCVFVPFSILLAIPGLTEHWYIRTNSSHEIVEFEANPLHIEVMLGFSMACAIVTNACLLLRLFEKMVKKMTIACIVALSIHDILDSTVIIMFIIKTQHDDGFSLGQAFWMTLCSTIASLATNMTLILDYWRTTDAERDRSGLTGKQRSLTIIIIVLLCYIALGAAVNTALLQLSFIDALYFTVVCIETVGFGDINPQTVGARLFSSIFTAIGILILAVAVGLIRDAIVEAIHANLYARVRRARRRRIMRRWIGALKWRLENAHLPVWVPVDHEGDLEWPSEMEIRSGMWQRLRWRWSDLFGVRRNTFSRHDPDIDQGPIPERGPKYMRLNLGALSEAQLQSAAMEAGAPLRDLIPRHPDHVGHLDHYEYCWSGGSETISPTHHRLGRMVAFLGTFAYTVSMGQRIPNADCKGQGEEEDLVRSRTEGRDEPGDGLTAVELEREEKRMFAIRLTSALSLFLTFWLVGSAIFTVTEKWSYGLALYFCFVTFSTVGYGDPVPKTPAGRSFFVGWALFGIGTMTILISLLADRYSERYKDIIAAAESTIVEEEGQVKQNNMTTSSPFRKLVAFDDQNSTGQEESKSIRGEVYDDFSSQEVLSRFDSFKALIVDDEGRFKEKRILHTLESELQSMLSLIRRSQKQASPDS